jgi:hypothetical protein
MGTGIVQERDVPLPRRLIWTIPDLAAMCGLTEYALRQQLPEDRALQQAVVLLPGGVDVPCFRDINSDRWVVYRHQVEGAIASLTPAT